MYFEVSHPDTNPAETGTNFSERLLWKGVRDSEYTLKLVVKKEVVRELENDQHVSLVASVSLFPFISLHLSGFSILLVTACLLSGLFT